MNNEQKIPEVLVRPGCEVPETMVNLPYMGTLADMSEAALFYCGYRIDDCGLKQPKSKIRHPKSDQS